MNKILALWATPRSTSTAFEWVMSHRGDMSCFHEPYNEAYYYGVDRRNHRYFIAKPDLAENNDLTMTSVHEKLIGLAKNEPVFIKDFAYSIMHMADDSFLDTFTHTFLIRHPEKVLTSMHSRWPDITLAEIGFEDLHTLFNRVADREGKVPLVLDSDALLKSPEAGVKAFCQGVGIPFIAESIKWQKKQTDQPDKNPTWNSDDHGFHDALKSSDGLKPQKRDYPPLTSNSDMLRLYDACLPHYEALSAHSLSFS